MPKMSRQVQNRIKVGEYVRSSIDVNGSGVANALADKVRNLDAPTVHGVLTALAVHLAGQGEALQTAEHAYTAEQADDPPLRNQRERSASELTEALGDLRDVIVQGFGEEGARRYGVSGETPRVPSVLAQHARNVVTLLRRHPASAKARFSSIDTSAAAGELLPLVETLDQHLAGVDREVRELQSALVDRDEAVAGWMGDYRGVATAVEGLYRLAGKGELADRIRPTARSAAGQETEGPDAATGDAPS